MAPGQPGGPTACRLGGPWGSASPAPLPGGLLQCLLSHEAPGVEVTGLRKSPGEGPEACTQVYLGGARSVQEAETLLVIVCRKALSSAVKSTLSRSLSSASGSCGLTAYSRVLCQSWPFKSVCTVGGLHSGRRPAPNCVQLLASPLSTASAMPRLRPWSGS